MILPRGGYPPDWVRKGLVREATKNPRITLKELEISIPQMNESVRWTNITWALHNTVLYGRVASHRTSCLAFYKKHGGDSANMWKEAL